MIALLVIALLGAEDEPQLEPSPDVLPVPDRRVVPEPPEPPPPPVVQSHARSNPMWEPTARGSASGQWGFTEAGLVAGAGFFLDARRFELLTFEHAVAFGWGFERAGVRVVPSAAFAWGFNVASLARIAAGLVSPVDLRVTMPDLLRDNRFTKLRLTPVLGATIPTSAGALFTALSLALQLERRFGRIEAAYRAEATRRFGISAVTPGGVPPWSLLNRLFVEAWLQPWVSAAIGLGLVSRWSEPVDGMTTQTSFWSSTVQVNFALNESVGLGVAMDSFMPTTDAAGNAVWLPFYAVGREAENLTTFALRLWLRSDELIQRNWIDR